MLSRGVKARSVTLVCTGDDGGLRDLLSRLPSEARQYMSAAERVDGVPLSAGSEDFSTSRARVFSALGVSDERLRRADSTFAFVTVFDDYMVNTEGASRLDWSAEERAPRRPFDRGNPGATRRASFTLRRLLPRVCIRARCTLMYFRPVCALSSVRQFALVGG